MVGECPHCGKQTECMLVAPAEQKTPAQTRAVIYTVIALIILVAGLIGAFVALKRAQRLFPPAQGREPQSGPGATTSPADKFAENGFRATPVTVDQAAGTSAIYARGTIANTTDRRRFGVKVDLELFDAAGARVGTASDYQGVIEPNAEWKFRALVVERQARSAQVLSIKETK